MKSLLYTTCLFLIVCSCLSTFNSDIPEKLCLRYSKLNTKTAKCETIGDTNGSGSPNWFSYLRFKAKVMLPVYIPYCIGYNSRGYCDYCVSGRAFNGKSCERCVKPPAREGYIKTEECEFPWEDLIKAMYSPRQRGVLGNIRDRCREFLNKGGRAGASQWDHCIRMSSRLQFPILIISQKQSTKGKSFKLQTRGHYLNWTRKTDKNADECNDVYSQGVCNCFAVTLSGNSCASCDIGFTREGVLKEEIVGDEYFTSDKDDQINTETWANYSNFKCSKTKVDHCSVLRPNWDVNGDEFECAHCDVKNHYKQAADGSCVSLK